MMEHMLDIMALQRVLSPPSAETVMARWLMASTLREDLLVNIGLSLDRGLAWLSHMASTLREGLLVK